MGYEIRYAHITDPQQRDAAALRDAKEFIGEDRWKFIGQNILQDFAILDPRSMGTKIALWKTIRFCLGFCGVQGYPARATWRFYMNALIAQREAQKCDC